MRPRRLRTSRHRASCRVASLDRARSVLKAPSDTRASPRAEHFTRAAPSSAYAIYPRMGRTAFKTPTTSALLRRSSRRRRTSAKRRSPYMPSTWTCCGARTTSRADSRRIDRDRLGCMRIESITVYSQAALFLFKVRRALPGARRRRAGARPQSRNCTAARFLISGLRMRFVNSWCAGCVA